MSLQINAFYPDANLNESQMGVSLTRTAMALAKLQHNEDPAPHVQIDVNFYLSGQHEAPEFTGMRIGQYDPEDTRLVVESAIPNHMNHSNNALPYVIAVLEDANENIAIFLDEIGVDYPLVNATRLLGRLKSDLSVRNT